MKITNSIVKLLLIFSPILCISCYFEKLEETISSTIRLALFFSIWLVVLFFGNKIFDLYRFSYIYWLMMSIGYIIIAIYSRSSYDLLYVKNFNTINTTILISIIISALLTLPFNALISALYQIFRNIKIYSDLILIIAGFILFIYTGCFIYKFVKYRRESLKLAME